MQIELSKNNDFIAVYEIIGATYKCITTGNTPQHYAFYKNVLKTLSKSKVVNSSFNSIVFEI